MKYFFFVSNEFVNLFLYIEIFQNFIKFLQQLFRKTKFKTNSDTVIAITRKVVEFDMKVFWKNISKVFKFCFFHEIS